MRNVSTSVSLLFLLVAPALAQTGNLVAPGQFDTSADIAAWQVINSTYSSKGFASSYDADGCSLSGAFDAVADPLIDNGSLEFRLCIGPFPDSAIYWVTGDFYFPLSSADGRANLTLNFYDGAGCTGSFVSGGLFAGYAQSSISGWQHVESLFSASQPVGAVSASISIVVTQFTGSDGPVEAFADNVRVVADAWIFADDFEVAGTCRWSAGPPP